MAGTTQPTTEDSVEQTITFTVKSSSDQKFSLTVPASSTVSDLKQTLSTSEYADLPPERQRLIYSGRVLKDPDTLGSCKIKDGNTVHLVKGAESNSRQNPASQGTTAAGTSNTSNVPTNIASGPGANNPLAHLTGARYAGMHGLPSMDMFGADGGMGAPPNPDQMLRLLEDPNFAQQMNEAMNNPAVIDMLRNNPMIRDNPMARAAIDNPEMRRMMFNPEVIRLQMQMQRAAGGSRGGAGNFPMPGQTDTTPGNDTTTPSDAPAAPPSTQNPFGATAGNPFAALFPGAAPPGNTDNAPAGATSQAQNPFGGLFGAQGGQQSPFQQAAQQMMQNPEAMRQMMQMMGGGSGAGAGAGVGGDAGFNPFAAFGSPEPQGPPDTRPPEERYADQLRQLNDMGFFDFERNIQALRRSGGSVQGAVEYLLSA
ncbi:hypothetical protein AMS68_003062 [Peltaster fructicola]|uniref:Ubiquitin-like domain-containing protein n=1 Tax=Peltaster fructicola TaxID=286661 RepID=A0A6H0XSD1_9PEZI|nr:hypothetical protein AMS68_003062 [Peltaster fructicola]